MARAKRVPLSEDLADLPALTDAERALMAEWLTRALTALRATPHVS